MPCRQADDAFSGLIEEKSFKIEFGFEDMGLALKGSGAKVLAGVSGAIKPHCVTAVMGPSGAGKTTFLSTLAGKAYYGTRSGPCCVRAISMLCLCCIRAVSDFVCVVTRYRGGDPSCAVHACMGGRGAGWVAAVRAASVLWVGARACGWVPAPVRAVVVLRCVTARA